MKKKVLLPIVFIALFGAIILQLLDKKHSAPDVSTTVEASAEYTEAPPKVVDVGNGD